MPKGCGVAYNRVKNQEKLQQFSGLAGLVIERYGGKVLVRGPSVERLEGDGSEIVMMIEFETKEAASELYYIDKYQAAKAVGEACSDTDFMIIEGLAD